MRRFAAIFLVAAVIISLVFVEQIRKPANNQGAVSVAVLPSESEIAAGDITADPNTVAEDLGLSSTASPVSLTSMSGGSSWYCPAGFATPDEANDHRIRVTNIASQPITGQLTLFPSLTDTLGESVPFERRTQEISVAQGAEVVVSLAPLIGSIDPQLGTATGAYVGAIVEFDDPGAVVTHSVVSPAGVDGGPCATSASSEWYFASGTTSPDVRYLMFLLNPFADDAVVDVNFTTDSGARSPVSFTGRLVRGQSLAVLDVSSEVTVQDQITATVTTRKGQVIAERLQVFSSEAGPNGLSLGMGANALADEWLFPASGAIENAGESFVIYNPGNETALIELEARSDNVSEADSTVVSLELAARERWVLNTTFVESHPVEVLAFIDGTTLFDKTGGYFVSMRSLNSVPFAAERVITKNPAAGVGVAASFGAVTASTDQITVMPRRNTGEGAGENVSGTLAVLNPSHDSIARVQIYTPSADGTEILQESVELAPRHRAVYSLGALDIRDARWVHIRSSVGVVAEVVSVDDSGLSQEKPVPIAEAVLNPFD